MRTFAWSQSLMIGHERIDSDHRVLIGLAGDIEEMLEDFGITDKAQETYDIFLSFLASHCHFEEKLMRQLPGLYTAQVDEHCRHHVILLDQARAMAPLFTSGKTSPELLDLFQRTIVAMTRDLILDDVELVGHLLRERQIDYSASA